MDKKILVTGATGDLGSRVINLLKVKTAVDNLAVLVRDKRIELAKQYHNDGIDVKLGDYANPESLEKAFKGIDILYFVSGGDDINRAKLHENVVNAAKSAGIKHIFYTSSVRKDESDASPLAGLVESHIKTENVIKACGIIYTIFRHNLYAEVIEMMIGQKRQLMEMKSIYLPASNGSVSFVPKKDLAEAEVKILLNPDFYKNKILEFNGSESITFSGIAEQISKIVNVPIRYISSDLIQFKAEMNRVGLPNHIIEILSTFGSAIAKGEFDQRSADLETVLGRKTSSLTDFLKETYN